MRDAPLNICLVSQEYPPETGWGGIGSYVYEMARALTATGHHVVVLSRANDVESCCLDNGVTVHRILPALNLGDRRFFWRFQRYLDGYRFAVSRKLEEIVAQRHIQVIEAPEIYSDLLWYQYAAINRPATVVRMHTSRWLVDQLCSTRPRLWNRLEYVAERETIRRADVVTSCSHALLARSRAYLPRREYHVVHNPIRDDIPVNSLDGDVSPEVLFAGRLEWRKGVQVFREVIPDVVGRAAAARFLFVGADGAAPGSTSMREHIASALTMDERSKVAFVGGVPRSEVFKYLAKRPVCVLPSLWENFPYACLEAMASGCAVIGSRNGGMAEMIEDGVTGFLVDPLNAGEISERILLLLKDSARRQAMGAAAARTVRERFSGAAIAAQTVEIYREAISRRSRT